ncbi:YjgN family protein [Aquabacterium sp.]|uniref:YjgN family protein n=1 Tax=Aquabacterium sp. TaxID=1872578 RepID=UPI002CEEE4A5|nr:YjgN family protein [Aquabacterium sp.]HSW05027.1 YjgN family protein [Aquabacterium sp.]
MDFQNTVPLDGAAGRSAAPIRVPAQATASTDARGDEQRLPVRFTGSGSEYFRIWIVNLLLMLVTLGFYYPFAKARRLRYFHDNTRVGEHALGFHGEPMKMLRGYLLMLLFAGCYAGAGYVSPTAGIVAALLFAALWPALWRASLRFRLANTSWRGLRLRFTGSTADAYRALLPLLLPGALFIALSAAQRGGAEPGAASMAASGLLLLSMLALVGLWPLGLAWIKRYQHGHYRYAGETSTLQTRTSAFYGIWLVMLLVSLVPLGLMILLLAIGGFALVASGGKAVWPLVLMTLGGIGFYLSLFFVSQPYFTAKLQNLVWSSTRSTHLRFESDLRFRALALLTFKNFLLMCVTLGLYRPFAAIHTARLRLEAVQLHASGDIASWASPAAGRFDDASGDAAGDLLGIDIGL